MQTRLFCGRGRRNWTDCYSCHWNRVFWGCEYDAGQCETFSRPSLSVPDPGANTHEYSNPVKLLLRFLLRNHVKTLWRCSTSPNCSTVFLPVWHGVRKMIRLCHLQRTQKWSGYFHTRLDIPNAWPPCSWWFWSKARKPFQSPPATPKSELMYGSENIVEFNNKWQEYKVDL